MKNKILLILLLAVATILLPTSCNKETQSDSINSNSLGFQTIEVQGKKGLVNLRLNKFAFDEIVKEKSNPQDEALNKEMLKVTTVLKDFVQRKDLVKFIVKSVKDSEDGAVSLKDILKQFPDIALKFDKSERYNNTFEHAGINYEIGISVPNENLLNEDFLPIFGVGIDLYDDVENKNPDMVFAYFTDNSSKQYQINIGENEALQVNNPVCITVPILRGNVVLPNVKGGIGNGLKNGTVQLRNTERTFIESYQIFDRFDKSSSTEFHMAAAKPFTQSVDDRLIESIFGDHVGQLRSINLTLKDGLIDNLIFNTYERDWFASRKFLGTTDNNGFQMLGRRSFFNEWYTFDPGIVNMSSGSSIWIRNDLLFANFFQSFTFNAQKGSMGIGFTP